MQQGPRRIIVEISGNGKDIVLRQDETASTFERVAILSTVIQMPDIPIIPLAEEKPLPKALQTNQTNNNEDGNKSKRDGEDSKRGSDSKRNKRGKSGKQ